ncbi:septal ring lytic transglycosylase RlpA family protein [Paralcaligenes ureilyticus]|uniref:Endolytic peptidoglycan transglycosylase RlpA n=1 Tax=Paralcaligenes ureilyticus TaxID=627131 RepID=A0A4R3MC20_9BURK|nr:septal ring lytic transglycosylase RlpA family protein [Paralcaligenes ureilyticus]TCT11224.1 rare lipoprotein A [Paralcaligenes ureilyticus]
MTPLRSFAAALTLISLVILAGCSTTRRGGGYYKDDGPGAHPPSNIDAIPDAVPRIETHSRATSRPYTVFGKNYVPLSSDRPFRQQGIASWYGKKFHGAKTSNGEIYDMYAMTAAHPILPIPSYARVTRVGTGKSIIVRINDRGPFHSSRIMDLSYVAAAKLGIIGPGSGEVIVDAITNQDIAQGQTHLDDIALATGGRVQPTTAAPVAVATAESRPVAIEPAPVAREQPRFDSRSEPASASEPTPNVMLALQSPSAAEDQTQEETEPATRAQDVDMAPTRGAATMAASNQIYLQFGAFSGPENARHMASKLNEQIGQIESRPAQVLTESHLYRVQIGPYPSRTAAVNAAVRIQQQTGAASTVAVR